MASLITYIFMDSNKTILEEVDLIDDESAINHGDLLVTKTKKPVFVYGHISTVYPGNEDIEGKHG